MNDTIDGFLDFFNPNKLKNDFNISVSIHRALDILKSRVHVGNIELNTNIDDSIEVYGVEVEFIQVIINIVNNSIDTLSTKDVNNREINNFLFII